MKNNKFINYIKNILPTNIPKNIDIVPAPNLGTNLAINTAISATATDTKNPGNIFLI